MPKFTAWNLYPEILLKENWKRNCPITLKKGEKRETQRKTVREKRSVKKVEKEIQRNLRNIK